MNQWSDQNCSQKGSFADDRAFAVKTGESEEESKKRKSAVTSREETDRRGWPKRMKRVGVDRGHVSRWIGENISRLCACL